MKKRKILATGALMTALLFTGASSALAQGASTTVSSQESVDNSLARNILSEQGFTPSQIQKLSAYKDSSKEDGDFSDEDE